MGYEAYAEAPPNKSLHRTFDPPPIFAAAKAAVAANAAELKRQISVHARSGLRLFRKAGRPNSFL